MTNFGQTYQTQRANAPARLNYLLSERNGTNHPQPIRLAGATKIKALRRAAKRMWAANDTNWKRGLLSDEEHEHFEQVITAELQAAIAPIHAQSMRETFGIEVQP